MGFFLRTHFPVELSSQKAKLQAQGNALAKRVGADAVVCAFTLQPAAVLGPGSYAFAVQLGSTGLAHNTHSDRFDLTYTSGGQLYAQSGKF